MACGVALNETVTYGDLNETRFCAPLNGLGRGQQTRPAGWPASAMESVLSPGDESSLRVDVPTRSR
ncbi:MAG: hypothetical protein ACP5I8_15420, partial [Phycisphaerae bacterium]